MLRPASRRNGVGEGQVRGLPIYLSLPFSPAEATG
jgi:hypothetical protein